MSGIRTYDKKCILGFMWSTRYSCPILMKIEFSRNIFEKYINIKFHENPSSWSRVVPCGRTNGQTDITKLTVAFRSFAKAPRNHSFYFVKSFVSGWPAVRKRPRSAVLKVLRTPRITFSKQTHRREALGIVRSDAWRSWTASVQCFIFTMLTFTKPVTQT
jgi:hypothetical protein